MEIQPWSKELPVAITVSDTLGNLIEMNNLARQIYAPDGQDLIHSNMLECHPEPSRTMLINMMQNQQTNIYTIEKNGVKKIIIQVPWFSQGNYQGHVELSVAIPESIPHFTREPK